MEKIYIKEMLEEHLDSVLEIEADAYGAHHWSKDGFRNEISNNLAHYICAFKKNEQDELELVGYSGIWTIFEEAHITTLAVSSRHRGQHVAQAILLAQIKFLYKNMVKYLTLEVRESNTKAISLYEKFGFKSLGKRKNYYQDNGEDALIMWTNNIFSDSYKKLHQELLENLNLEIIYE